MLDNYDSFTYNLVHLVEKVSEADIEVHQNDKISIQEIERFDKIILSPGPGIPAEAGVMMDAIRKYAGEKSIFGVCLGLQAIGGVFGGKLINLDQVCHGIATPVSVIEDDFIFSDVPKKFSAGRYHSWVLDKNNFSTEMRITAVDEKGIVMAAKHCSLDVRGVQFHPESILSEYGEQIIRNWIHR